MSAILPWNLKKATKPSVCWVNRCTAMTSGQLCEKHHAEWVEAGQPPLVYAAPAPAAPKSEITQVPPERQAALAAERAELTKYLEGAQSFPLDTDENMGKAQGAMNYAHEMAKALEKEMKSALEPLKEVEKTIKSWFKPNIDTFLAVKDTFSRRIGAEVARREAARVEALRQIAASAATAPAEAFRDAHAIVAAPTESGGLIETVYVTVVDFALLPEEYKIQVVNQPKLELAAKANPRADIPGCKITVETRTRVGR